MTRIRALSVLVLAASLAGCWLWQTVSDRHAAFVEGVDTYYLGSGLYKEYVKYVKGDAGADEKRNQAAAFALKVRIEDEKKDVKDGKGDEEGFLEDVEEAYLENGIHDAYINYVNKDPKITRQTTRDIRTDSARKLKALLESERKALE